MSYGACPLFISPPSGRRRTSIRVSWTGPRPFQASQQHLSTKFSFASSTARAWS